MTSFPSAFLLLERLELEFRPPVAADGDGPLLAALLLRLEHLPAAVAVVLDVDGFVAASDVAHLRLLEEIVLALVAHGDPSYGELELPDYQTSNRFNIRTKTGLKELLAMTTQPSSMS